jgi:transposase
MQEQLFTGKQMYIGIDVHLKQWNVGIFSEKSFHRVFQQPPDSAILKNYMVQNFPGATYYTVYEVGLTGFSTHRQLESEGFINTVVHPGDVPTMDKERRQKRDKSDAIKLGRALRAGDLGKVFVPSLQVQQDRELIRYRCNKLVPKLTRVKNQIKSYLCLYGIEIPADFSQPASHWSKAWVEWLHNVHLEHTGGQQALKHLIEELTFYEAKLRLVNRQIAALSRQDAYYQQVQLLRTVPGVGLLVAMVVLTEIESMDRFDSLDSLCHYVGLVPNVYASDVKERVGQQTRRGNALLRRMLLQSAWVAKNRDPALLHKFESLTQRMNANKAIVRIQKKLLSRIRRVMLTGEPYKCGVMQ